MPRFAHSSTLQGVHIGQKSHFWIDYLHTKCANSLPFINRYNARHMNISLLFFRRL
ncbi:hypothetical protein HanRHA438_Chr16g0745321 [Helianthus annuus]|nr:hypothetical protein HanIR_Chr16g0797121 [Helianthus annuus]KAJ0834586.1 hypothetical protein HanRHA438_Chr16g0745321 [Helianthus annuus]